MDTSKEYFLLWLLKIISIYFRYPLLSDQDLALLLERVGPDFEKPKLEFPKLTSNQRKFGVNPAYSPEPVVDAAEDGVEQTSANGKIVVTLK